MRCAHDAVSLSLPFLRNHITFTDALMWKDHFHISADQAEDTSAHFPYWRVLYHVFSSRSSSPSAAVFDADDVHVCLLVTSCVWSACLSVCVCWEPLKQGSFVLYCAPWHGHSPPISRGRHSCFHSSMACRMDTMMFSCSVSFVC